MIIAKIGFIGAGKVGVSLGKYFSRKGLTPLGYYSRSYVSSKEAADYTGSISFKDLKELVEACDLLFITTPDHSITNVWNNISNSDISLKDKFICHCSGSLTSDIFSNINNFGAFGYSIHPLWAFSDKYNSHEKLENAFFSIEGHDQHIKTIETFIKSFGNNTFILPKDKKSLYHLANVTVSNLVLSLLSKGTDYLSCCGLSKDNALEALMPLIQNNISNIKNNGFTNSLTGPIERNDLNTLIHHIEVIPKEDIPMYKNLSLKLLNLSTDKYKEKNYDKTKTYLGGL